MQIHAAGGGGSVQANLCNKMRHVDSYVKSHVVHKDVKVCLS